MYDRWFRIRHYNIHIAIEDKPHFFGWSLVSVTESHSYVIGFCLDRLGIYLCMEC